MTRSGPAADGLPTDIDAVYFLAWPTWDSELPGNRWHFARRWARRVPVVVVQATLPHAAVDPRTEPESRIDNCEILRTRAPRGALPSPGDPPVDLETALVQAGHVLGHMHERGYRRPLLWCYDPRLAGLYAGLPAEKRVFHATENFFDYEDVHPSFLSQVRAACASSDVVIAVSGGVASALEQEVDVRVAVVTNGCDFSLYSGAQPDPELVEASRAFARTAIYAGNVNARLDFPLLHASAEAHPETYFVFFGRVTSLSAANQREWDRLLERRNVSFGEEVPATRLPALYAASDVGFIPYRRERYLVENGFPLKLLEMAATGLPVVATLMKPIMGLAEGLLVASSDQEFVAGMGEVSRGALRREQRDELIRVASDNDYDVKFEEVLDLLRQTEPIQHRSVRLMLAYVSLLRRFHRLYLRVPESVRLLMPGSLRRIARGAFLPGSSD